MARQQRMSTSTSSSFNYRYRRSFCLKEDKTKVLKNGEADTLKPSQNSRTTVSSFPTKNSLFSISPKTHSTKLLLEVLLDVPKSQATSATEDTMEGPKIPGFFKAFVAHHSSQTLEIPRSYAKRIKLETPQYVYLMGSSERNWPVRLVRDDNHRLYLQQGWPEFVKCHSLENMDILVFKYDGGVNFKVKIFDGCSSVKRVAFDGESLNDSRVPERNKRGEVNAPAPSVNACEDAQNVAQSPSQETEHETEKHRAANCCTKDRRSFVKPIRDYNVGRSFVLAVPAWFVTEHFSSDRKKIEIVLQNKEGTEWPVILNYKSSQLHAGWSAFVRDNQIKEGDTCTFEHVHKLKMLVHIYKQQAPSQSKQVKRLATPEEPQTFGAKKKRRVSRYCASIAGPSSIGIIKNDTRQDHISEGAQKVAQVPSQGHTKFETEKHRAANSRTKDRLSFVKPIRDYNASRPFVIAIPAWFVTEHFSSNKEKIGIVLQNKEGMEWPVILKYKLRALHAGWSKFVRDNQIKEGDTCTFQLVHKKKLLVHISKQRAPSQSKQVKRLATPEEPQAFGAKKKRQVGRYRASIADPSSIGIIKNDTRQDHISEGAQKVAQVPSQGHTKFGAGKQRWAESHANDYPSFAVTMRKFNIHSSIINVKSTYFSNHWSSYGKKAQFVVQNQEGKQWSVNLCCYEKRGYLSGGWLRFVRDNHIKEKDICTFKLVKAREMHVHISRHSAPSHVREGSEGRDVMSEDQVGNSFGVNKSSEEDVVARQVEAATARVVEELREQKVKTEKATEEIAELREQNRRIMEMLDALKNSGASSSASH